MCNHAILLPVGLFLLGPRSAYSASLRQNAALERTCAAGGTRSGLAHNSTVAPVLCGARKRFRKWECQFKRADRRIYFTLHSLGLAALFDIRREPVWGGQERKRRGRRKRLLRSSAPKREIGQAQSPHRCTIRNHSHAATKDSPDSVYAPSKTKILGAPTTPRKDAAKRLSAVTKIRPSRIASAA